jgi:hypothetical protein
MWPFVLIDLRRQTALTDLTDPTHKTDLTHSPYWLVVIGRGVVSPSLNPSAHLIASRYICFTSR